VVGEVGGGGAEGCCRRRKLKKEASTEEDGRWRAEPVEDTSWLAELVMHSCLSATGCSLRRS
jgi:hypothetical protein